MTSSSRDARSWPVRSATCSPRTRTGGGAIALYSQGITEKTTDVDLLSKRARAYEALQNWDAATADWSRAATGNPDRAKLLAEFARRLAAGGQVPLAKAQFEKAQALYERMLEAEPENDRQAWKELGIVRAELGQPEEAAAAFTKLMELTPDSRDESLWWAPDPAGINEALAAHDEIFGRVVQARPRNRTLLIARFHYFGRRRRWREAAEMAARIVELDPQDGQARQFRRALLLFTGDLEGYRRAIREELAALNERTPIAVGWLEMLGQYEFSRADATGPPPQNEWESLSRGINDYREGRYGGAIRQLTEVTRPSAHPLARTLAHIFLAMAHQRLGQMAEAGRELDAGRKGLDGLGGGPWRREFNRGGTDELRMDGVGDRDRRPPRGRGADRLRSDLPGRPVRPMMPAPNPAACAASATPAAPVRRGDPQEVRPIPGPLTYQARRRRPKGECCRSGGRSC